METSMPSKIAARELVPPMPAASPHVIAVYWDPHFKRNPGDVVVFDAFLHALFQSSWSCALSDHGLAPARLLLSAVPTDRPPPTLTAARLRQQLREWIESGQLAPKRRAALTYLIFTPLETVLSGVTSHSGPDLSYAVVPLQSTGPEILELHSLRVSQELSRVLVGSRARAGALRTAPSNDSHPRLRPVPGP
jgi:hypothetical protein